MGRAKYRSGEVFARLPVRVLVSEAFKTMKAHHQMVLVVLAAQYRGENNGDLALTRKMALHFGIKSERARCQGLRELAERGLIVKACQGGMRPLGPTTWALTWSAIDYWAGRKLDAVRVPPESWKNWQPNLINDSPRDSSTTPHVSVVKPINDTPRDSSEAHLTAPHVEAPSRTLAGTPREWIRYFLVRERKSNHGEGRD